MFIGWPSTGVELCQESVKFHHNLSFLLMRFGMQFHTLTAQLARCNWPE